MHAVVGPDTLPSGLPIEDEFLLRLLDDSLLSERLFSEQKESFVPWPTAGEQCFRFAVTFARAAAAERVRGSQKHVVNLSLKKRLQSKLRVCLTAACDSPED